MTEKKKKKNRPSGFWLVAELPSETHGIDWVSVLKESKPDFRGSQMYFYYTTVLTLLLGQWFLNIFLAIKSLAQIKFHKQTHYRLDKRNADVVKIALLGHLSSSRGGSERL